MPEENNKKQEEQNNKKREEHPTRIGPLLKKLFEKQKQIVKETTWECITPSDYEVGEIIAKKIADKNIL